MKIKFSFICIFLVLKIYSNEIVLKSNYKTTSFNQVKNETQSNINTIDLIWDASYSMSKKKLEKEIEFLDQYIDKLQNLNINLTVFSNIIIDKKSYTITNGDWSKMKTKLLTIKYDGSTNFSILESIIENSSNYKTLLFSDLNRNLEKVTFNFKKNLIIINSTNNVNNDLSEFINSNLRNYIDLNKKDVSTTMQQVFGTLNVKTSKKIISNTPKEIKGEFTISGIVSDNIGGISEVTISVNNTSKGTITDLNGQYSLKVKIGDQLTFSHVSYKTNIAKVFSSKLNIIMTTLSNTLDEVNLKGNKKIDSKKLASGIPITKIEGKDIEHKQNLFDALKGKVPGLTGNPVLGLSDIRLRETRSLGVLASQPPMFILDGHEISITNLESTLFPNNIKSVEVIRGLSGTSRYGSNARGGVIKIYSKTNEFISSSKSKKNKKKKGKKVISIKNNAEYLTAFDNLQTKNDFYKTYLNQRDKYSKFPAYFIDMHDLFKSKGHLTFANRILSNMIEIHNSDYKKLRAYAYKLEKATYNNLAVNAYKRIFEIHPQETQSFRDLALAFQKNNQPEKAAEILDYIVSGKIYGNDSNVTLDGVDENAKIELNNLVSTNESLISNKNYNKYNKNEANDLRIVIDWNHDDTDIDLFIIDPKKEVCYLGNPKTKIGGKISKDMSSFGPESYTIKQAMNGAYFVKLSFNRDFKTAIEDPTFIKISIFKNYGRKNQTLKIKIIRLSGKSKEYILARVDF